MNELKIITHLFSYSFTAMQGDSERYVYPRGNFTIYKTNTEKSYVTKYFYVLDFFFSFQNMRPSN